MTSELNMQVIQVNREILFGQIHSLLNSLVTMIERENTLNLTGKANFAEDIFARVLNNIFGFNLTNANDERSNVDTIDLEDRHRSIAVQVTSNQQFSTKKKNTLKGFTNGATHSGIKKLIILYLSSKEVSKTVLAIQSVDATRLVEGYDIHTILRTIKSLEPLRLQELATILEEELQPLVRPSRAIQVDLKHLRDSQPKNDPKGLQIHRENALTSFTAACDGQRTMITGQPGVGKSHLLNAFNERTWSNGGCCVLFQIDKFLSGTPAELSRILGTKEDWIEFLSAVNRTLECYLLFDAFDTARGSSLNEMVLERIAEAIAALPSNWKIIASVRTFDAQKSPKLKSLFSQNNGTHPIRAGHFELLPLTNDELKTTLDGHLTLTKVFDSCRKDLQKVLTTPYFLKIFEEVVFVNDKGVITRLKGIVTQEQLLDIYWDRKIAGHELGTAIERAAQTMAEEMFSAERLNVERRVILQKVDASALDLLHAEGIITDVQVDRLAFKHNILFDYAVARLILAQDPIAFVAQINTNLKAPFIFRPSYWMFAHRLWKLQRDAFWRLYHCVWGQTGNEFQLLHQLIFNSILASSFVTFSDLKPLFAKAWKARYGMYARRLLDALRFTEREGFRGQDMELIDALSMDIRTDFVWHLGMFIRRAQDLGYKEAAAEPAVRYTEHLLGRRDSAGNTKQFLDRMAGFWGIPAITQLPISYRPRIKQIVEHILSLLPAPDFPIEYANGLADHLSFVLSIDSSLAEQVFLKLYRHNELSDSPTTMGGGVVVSFKSTRRQDYDLCKYGLEEDFPKFLNSKPQVGIRIAVKLTNEMKGYRWKKLSKTIPVKFGSVAAKFRADMEIGDWDPDIQEGVGKLLHAALTFIEELFANGGNPNLAAHLLATYVKHACTAYVWKQILKMLTRQPKNSYRQSLMLLENDIFFLASETAYETAELIKAITPFATAGEMKKLEKRIIALPKSALSDGNDSEFLELRIVKALSGIPLPKLSYQFSRKLRTKYGGYENTPIIASSGFIRSVEDDHERLQRLGVALDDGAAIALDVRQQRLTKMVNAQGKADASSANEKNSIAQETFALYATVKNARGLSERLEDECKEAVAKGARWLSESSSLSKARAAKCFAICKNYLEAQDGDSLTYNPGQLKGRVVTYSPTARKTVAHVLPMFSRRNDVRGFGELLGRSMVDNDPIVRAMAMDAIGYLHTNDREAYWKWTLDRSTLETDGWCITFMLHGLCWGSVLRSEGDKVDAVVKITAPRILTAQLSYRDSVIEHLVTLLFCMIQITQSATAKEIIARNRSHQAFQRAVITNMTKRLERMLQSSSHNESDQHIVDYCRQELPELLSAQFESLRAVVIYDESSKNLLQEIDYAVQRITFTARKAGPPGKERTVSEEHYRFFQPILDRLLEESNNLHGGLMIARTGYYAAQYLELCLSIDPDAVLRQVFEIVRLSQPANFASDKQTLDVVIRIIESSLADYRASLLRPELFSGLLQTLSIFVESGWQEALELVWKLNEVFD